MNLYEFINQAKQSQEKATEKTPQRKKAPKQATTQPNKENALKTKIKGNLQSFEKKETKSEKISVRLTPSNLNKLDALCDKMQSNRQEIVNQIIEIMSDKMSDK